MELVPIKGLGLIRIYPTFSDAEANVNDIELTVKETALVN